MCDLKVRFTQSPERRDVFEYALRAEVVSAEGISPKIFVYHQMPTGLDGNTFAEFDHVATPVDMQEIPEDAATDIVPWYRTNKVTVWLRNASDLDTVKQLLMNDISWLQKAYSHLSSENDFTVQETVDFHGEGECTHPSKEEEDSMSRRINKIEGELKNKVDKDILSGVDIAANTADGMRESIGVIGNVLDATIRSISAFLCLSCVTAFGAEVYTAEYNTLDLDTYPSIVTNVTFDGLAMSSNTYTKAETDAKIVELAPAPGNYNVVSNAAMNAAQKNDNWLPYTEDSPDGFETFLFRDFIYPRSFVYTGSAAAFKWGLPDDVPDGISYLASTGYVDRAIAGDAAAATNYTDAAIANADTTYRRTVGVTNLNQSVQYVNITDASPSTLQIQMPTNGETKDWMVYVNAATNVTISLPPATWWMADVAYTNDVPGGKPTALWFSQISDSIYIFGRQELTEVQLK